MYVLPSESCIMVTARSNKKNKLGKGISCRTLNLHAFVIGALLISINNVRIILQSPMFNGEISQIPLLPLVKYRDNNNISSALQCLDLNSNQELDSMISRASQIFVTMPSKGGGTSMNSFTARCGHTSEGTSGLPYAFIQKYKYKNLLDKPIVNSSSIFSSHISNDTSLIHLAKRSEEKVLILYIHRDQNERDISGIKMIAHHMCRYGKRERENQLHLQKLYSQVVVAKNNTHCVIDEKSFGKMIAEGHREAGGGAPKILTCSLFDALQLTRPQFVFLHYKQIDKLQTLLAKYHCPELQDELPIRANVAGNKPTKFFIYDGKGDANNKAGINEIFHAKGIVRMEDWLDAKGAVLEGALASLSQRNERIATGLKETAQMQNKLFGCADEALKIVPRSKATEDEEMRKH